MGTGDPFSGVKRGPSVTLTTQSHLVPNSGMRRSYTFSPLAPAWRSGTVLIYFYVSLNQNHATFRHWRESGVCPRPLTFFFFCIYPWRYSSDEPWPAEQPPLAVFPDCTRRYWVDVVSTSNPTAAFSALQTGPLLLYSSYYSVYPITRLSVPY
jgi:hypothetical protein